MSEAPTAEECTVAADIPCVGCGYNLRTLRRDAMCPECGRAVQDSVRTDALRLAALGGLRRVRVGVTWLLVVGVIWLIASPARRTANSRPKERGGLANAKRQPSVSTSMAAPVGNASSTRSRHERSRNVCHTAAGPIPSTR